MSTFTDALAAGPIVLDGGLGTLLEAHGHDLSSSLWSARLLIEDPEAIRRAHAEFFAAGARVAITSSYQVSSHRTGCRGSRSPRRRRAARTERAAGAQAREDAGLSSDEAWVAASVGPYGASLADGSEYTGDYGLDVAQLREWHRPRLQALAAAGPDVIAVETMPSLAELEAVCRELDGLGIPAWVSVTIADGGLRSGESLAEAFALARVGARGRRRRCELLRRGGGRRCARRSGRRRSRASSTRTAASSGTPTRAQWSGEASAIAARAGDWVARRCAARGRMLSRRARSDRARSPGRSRRSRA